MFNLVFCGKIHSLPSVLFLGIWVFSLLIPLFGGGKFDVSSLSLGIRGCHHLFGI